MFDKLTTVTSSTQSDHRKLIENPRLNLICIQYEIIEPPEKEIPGHRWVNNNTTYLDHKEEFECGQVTYRVINDIKLVLWLPERVVDKRHIRDCTSKAYAEAQVYADWFQKRFKCKLGPPEIYQNYHLAFQENDPLLCDYVAKYGLIKMVDGDGKVITWYDRSKGYTECETHDERIAEAKAFAAIKIVDLEDRVFNFEKAIDSIVDEKIKNFEKAIVDKIVNAVGTRISAIIEKKISELFEKPKLPDTFNDVT